MSTETKRTADSIKVGDRVDFEGNGSLVWVLSIDASEETFDSEPYRTEAYGKQLVFDCNYSEDDFEAAKLVGMNTFYVRREKSPISGLVQR